MRVSAGLEELAAPYLYEKLAWKDVQRGALEMVGRQGKKDIGNEAKTDALQHIRVVELHPHAFFVCPHPIHATLRRQDIIVVPALRVDTSKLCPTIFLGLVSLSGRSCCTLARLAPKRLVIVTDDCEDGGTPSPHLDRLNTQHLEEVVVHVNIHVRQWPSCILGIATPSKRLVIIVRPYGHIYNDSNSERDDGLEDYQDGTGREGWARDLAHRIVKLAWDQHTSRDIVVVNHHELDGGQPVGFERWCRDLLASGLRDILSPRDTSSTTPMTFKLATLKFITTKEYLTEYDWEGVYTDHEAASLLEQALRDDSARD